MKHLVLVAAIALAAVLGGGTGCNKPTSDECEQAIRNMQRLLSTDTALSTADLQGEVRRCQGGSSREAVACAIKATTPDDLKACSFMGPPKKSTP